MKWQAADLGCNHVSLLFDELAYGDACTAEKKELRQRSFASAPQGSDSCPIITFTVCNVFTKVILLFSYEIDIQIAMRTVIHGGTYRRVGIV